MTIFPPSSALAAYPIGAIYLSVNPTNPGSLFGGTWAAWGTGRVPIAVDTAQTEFNTVEKVGGAKTVPLDSTSSAIYKSAAEATGYGLTSSTAFGNRAIVGSPTQTALPILQPFITCFMWKRTA